MEEEQIYFGASIRGGVVDVEARDAMVKHLQKYGKVLTEHVSGKSLTSSGEALPNQIIHDRDLFWLQRTKRPVMEVSTTSFGVGYEIGRAVGDGKNVLCLVKPENNKNMSAMIAGCPDTIFREYRGLDEAFGHIDAFFSQPAATRLLPMEMPHLREIYRPKGMDTHIWPMFKRFIELDGKELRKVIDVSHIRDKKEGPGIAQMEFDYQVTFRCGCDTPLRWLEQISDEFETVLDPWAWYPWSDSEPFNADAELPKDHPVDVVQEYMVPRLLLNMDPKARLDVVSFVKTKPIPNKTRDIIEKVMEYQAPPALLSVEGEDWLELPADRSRYMEEKAAKRVPKRVFAQRTLTQ